MFKSVLVIFFAVVTCQALGISPGLRRVGGKYLVSTSTATFFEALVTCKANDGSLATVPSENEQSLINITLGSKADTFWLGGVYAISVFESKWIWIDSGLEVTYSNWGSNQPSLETDINCIAMSAGKWIAHRWDREYYFICEV